MVALKKIVLKKTALKKICIPMEYTLAMLQ